jgi:hypothetical protein
MLENSGNPSLRHSRRVRMRERASHDVALEKVLIGIA